MGLFAIPILTEMLRDECIRGRVNHAKAFPALKELSVELTSRLSHHGFGEAKDVLPGFGDGTFPTIANGRVFIAFLPFDSDGLRIDIAVDALAPANEFPLYHAGCCGGLEFMFLTELMFFQPGEADRAMNNVVAVLPSARAIAKRYPSVRGR